MSVLSLHVDGDMNTEHMIYRVTEEEGIDM